MSKDQFKKRFVELLRKNEGALSDGYHFYQDSEEDVDALLEKIAEELWVELEL